jgi:hypothetical protein
VLSHAFNGHWNSYHDEDLLINDAIILNCGDLNDDLRLSSFNYDALDLAINDEAILNDGDDFPIDGDYLVCVLAYVKRIHALAFQVHRSVLKEL